MTVSYLLSSENCFPLVRASLWVSPTPLSGPAHTGAPNQKHWLLGTPRYQ